jgi:nucleotide-binding universal stress UspA family protein
MFKKVVWATDGSEAADHALPLVKTLAADDGELLVIHCDELMLPARGTKVPLRADEQDLKAKIERQIAELSQAGVRAKLQVAKSVAGGAAHAIADIAGSEKADVIVVGTRGHTPIGGLLQGSVTQRLLHISPCPVLAVPNGNHGHGA